MLIQSIHTIGRKILDLFMTPVSSDCDFRHQLLELGNKRKDEERIFSCSASHFQFLVSVQTKLSLFLLPFICICVTMCTYMADTGKCNLLMLWSTSLLHVRLHPLCVSVGIIGMLGSVGEPRGTSVFPKSSLWGSGTATSSYARPHPVNLVCWPTFQWGKAGWSKTHPKCWIVWRVAIIVVS